MPPGDFIRKVVIRLVLLDRPAKGRTCLNARVSGIGHRAEGIYGLKIAVAQITEHGAMHLI